MSSIERKALYEEARNASEGPRISVAWKSVLAYEDTKTHASTGKKTLCGRQIDRSWKEARRTASMVTCQRCQGAL